MRKDRLDPEVLGQLQAEFTYKNPEKAFKRRLGIWVNNIPDDIETWKTEGKYISFPRGGMAKIRDVLEAYAVEFRISDRRTEGVPCLNFPKYIGPELRYYQEAGVQAALKKEHCVIRAPTASGKSLLAMALASRIKLNTLVILPTVGLFNQWVKDAKAALDVGSLGIGIIHGKKRVLRPITAAVQKSLAVRGIAQEENDFFGVIIVDECQKAAAISYAAVVDPWTARYRIGISADERRRDRKDFLTRDLLGEKAYEVKRSVLEDQGHVLDVEIRAIPTDFQAEWYGLPEEVAEGEELDPDAQEKDIDFSRLLDEMTADPKRDKLALGAALKEVTAGNQIIILTHRRDHCHKLEQTFVKNRVATGFFIGGNDFAKQFEATKLGIADKSLQVGIGTFSALGVGVNLPSVAAGVAVTPIAGNKYFFNQVRGRLSRLSDGKKKGILYVLWDRNVYPGHLRNMVSWNPTVKVLIKGKWVDARKYLGMRKRRAS